jgi:predicted lipid-binding transport protein (Tim44 family)
LIDKGASLIYPASSNRKGQSPRMAPTPDPPPASSGPGQAAAQPPARPSLAKIIGGTVALAALTIIGTYVFGGFSGLSAGGVMALILGVSLSYALGVGLMVAVFYSSRFYDEDAHNAALEQFKDRHDDL